MALVFLTGCLVVPSFAGDVLGHNAKVAGKNSVKAVTATVKASAKAVGAVGNFLF